MLNLSTLCGMTTCSQHNLKTKYISININFKKKKLIGLCNNAIGYNIFQLFFTYYF